MIDSIGPKPSDRKITAVTRVAAPASAVSVEKQAAAAQTTTVAARLSVSAPVDVDRVQRIKQAIADGKFPLSPSTIADALIAARYEWMSNDQA